MPKISEARRAEVRDRILAAARRVVGQRGIHETSMDDIVEASGLSKGAIYGHFESKEQLLLALQDLTLERRIEEVTSRFSDQVSSTERINQLLTTYLDWAQAASTDQLRLNIELLLSAAHRRSLRSRIDARYERHHKLFAGLLRQGRQRGEYRADLDAEGTAAILLALLDGCTLEWALTTPRRNRAPRILRSIQSALFDGVSRSFAPSRGRGEP